MARSLTAPSITARPGEAAKFDRWCQRTLERYRHFFGDESTDLWPPPSVRFGRDVHHRRVNTQEHWIIPKPRLPGNRWLVPCLLGLVSVLALAGLSRTDWPGVDQHGFILGASNPLPVAIAGAIGIALFLATWVSTRQCS